MTYYNFVLYKPDTRETYTSLDYLSLVICKAELTSRLEGLLVQEEDLSIIDVSITENESHEIENYSALEFMLSVT